MKLRFLQDYRPVFFAVLICGLSMCFSVDACGNQLTPSEEGKLLAKICYCLKEVRVNNDKAKNLSKKIKFLRGRDLYRRIMNAPECAINVYIINILIKKFPSIAHELFQCARCFGCADVVTFSSYMTAAGNAGRFADVRSAFDHVAGVDRDRESGRITRIRGGRADIFTYSAYITAAGNAGEFADARFVFDHVAGVKREIDREREGRITRIIGGRADIVTYNSYITAAGNANEFADARVVFDHVAEVDRESGRITRIRGGRANTVTYNAYITAAGNAGEFNDARFVFDRVAGVKREIDRERGKNN